MKTLIVYSSRETGNSRKIAEALAAAGSGTLTKESLESMTRDGFLWFGGYLYRLGDDGYFLTDSEFDGLYFENRPLYERQRRAR